MPDSDSSGGLPAWVREPDRVEQNERNFSPTSSPESDLAPSIQPCSHSKDAARGNEPAGPLKSSKPDLVTALLTQSKVVEQTGQVPVLLPETLSTSRCLVEVESAGGALDLAGDSGAVGRFAVKDSGDTPHMLLDLKGQIYSLKMVPSASTLCVVNIKQTEAKIEALLSDYVQLQPASWSDAIQEQDLRNLMADDDENYQQDEATEQGSKPSAAANKKKAASKPKSRMASKGTAKSSGGSKQPPKKRQKQHK